MPSGEEVAARERRCSGICVDITETEQRRERHVDMGEAGVLPEGHVVGEIALELIADHLLLALEGIDAGIAGEQAGRNPAERRGGDGADIGQEVEAAGLVSSRLTPTR